MTHQSNAFSDKSVIWLPLKSSRDKPLIGTHEVVDSVWILLSRRSNVDNWLETGMVSRRFSLRSRCWIRLSVFK